MSPGEIAGALALTGVVLAVVAGWMDSQRVDGLSFLFGFASAGSFVAAAWVGLSTL